MEDQNNNQDKDKAVAGNLLQQLQIQAALESDQNVMVLKILNGLHRGSEVQLHAGTYTIGSSDECDFVLKDSGIEAEHLMLLCRNNRYTVIKKDGNIHLEGKRIEKNEVELDSKTVAKIGSVFIGFMSCEDDWEPNLLPDEVDGNTDETQGGIIAEEPVEIKNASEKIDEKKKIDNGTAPQENPAVRSKSKRFRLHAVAACMIVVIFICGYKIFGSQETAKDEPGYTVEEIAALFQESNLHAPQIFYKPGSIPEVTGYTLTQDKQESIVQKIQALPFEVKYAIYSREKIESTCRQVIKRMDWKFNVEYIDQGSLVLKGFIKEQEIADVVVDQLKREVSGIRKLDEKLWVIDEAKSNLSDILSRFRLSGKISWQFMNGYILASGILEEQEWQAWQVAKEQIHSQFGSEFTIKEKVKVAHEVQLLPGKIHLPIKCVNLGEQPYITLIDGRRYFKGGPLKRGRFIKDISADGIVIDINGREYHYEIAREKVMPKNMVNELDKLAMSNATTEGRILAPQKKKSYDQYIAEAASRYDISPDLIKAVIQVESAFDPHAVSIKGAMGLMQIMPLNFNKLNISNPFDPRQNIMGGTRYIRELLNQFDQQLPLALAAYNAGPGAVLRYKGIPRYEETQNYVKKVMQLYRKSQAPASVSDENEIENLSFIDRSYRSSLNIGKQSRWKRMRRVS